MAALLTASACTSPLPRLANTHPSPQALAAAIVNAIAERDESRLRALALSEVEFREFVWPFLPAARPERNLPFSYVWGDLKQKSDLTLRGTLAEHGGRKYEVRRVKFSGSPRDYGEFQVYSEATFVVPNESGTEVDLRVCGSFIAFGDEWKVFSYVIER